MLLKEKEKTNIFEKKKFNKFYDISMIQMLTIWNKETRELWKKKFLIDTLIEEKDFSTLFELENNNFKFTISQYKKIIKNLNKALVDNYYQDKFSLIKIMDQYKIEIPNETYYHFCISNVFNKAIKTISVDPNDIANENEKICYRILTLLKDKNFKEGLKEFIVKDIEKKPNELSESLKWSMSRSVYYEPCKNMHLFGNMEKSQYKRILKIGIGNAIVMNDYKALANQAKIDLEVLETLGINTKTIIEKAQKTLLLREESLTTEMKEVIENISCEIEKIQKKENGQYSKVYKEEIYKLVEETLPNVIKKYLSIDEEYRNTLKNIEGKYPSDLLLESLNNIYQQVNMMNQCMNEEKVSNLSIDNRKIKQKIIKLN